MTNMKPKESKLLREFRSFI